LLLLHLSSLLLPHQHRSSSIMMALRHFGGPAVAFAVAALSRFLRAIV
jgi:hypothetical protein